MPIISLIFLVSVSLMAATNSEITEAKSSIKALLSPLLPGARGQKPKGTEKFRVDGCEKKQVDWTDVLFMRKTVTLEFKYKEGCDIQGTITPKVFVSFPARLNLRNLDHYKEIEGSNKITAGLESKPILFLEVRSGILSGSKGKVKFEADYKVRVNPMDPKNPVAENLGGEIRITEVFGEKTNIKEVIQVR